MVDTTRGARRLIPWIVASIGYVGLTIVYTWPLIIRVSSVLPNDPVDPGLNTWILWWNAQTVPFTARWWNAPAFWPSKGVLAFSEVLLGFSPFTSPVQWFGGSPITAYNLAFLLTFPLSALAAHVLAFRLTARHDAGVIGGLVYGFNPFRAAHLAHIQVLASFWIPLVFVALHEYCATRRKQWLVVLGVCWLFLAFSNGYYLLFTPVLIGMWFCWFASRSTARAVAETLSTLALASIPLVALWLGYRSVHTGLNLHRDFADVNVFSADVASLLTATPLLKFWQLHMFDHPEGEFFPGFTAPVLILMLAIHASWRSSRAARASRSAIVVLLGSMFFALIAAGTQVFGRWTIALGQTTLVTATQAIKPLTAAIVLLIAGLALYLQRSPGWRGRSPAMFYALAAALMYFLGFGPQPRVFGNPIMWRGPYALLMSLPGYEAVRSPARFAMLAVLCLAIVAALAFARLTARTGPAMRVALSIAAVCGILVDSAIGETPLTPLPPRIAAVESLRSAAPVMELPLGDPIADTAALYRGMYHGHPVINGYSGFFPPSYVVLRSGLNMRDPEMFDALTAWGPLIVAVDTRLDWEDAWVKQLENRAGTTLVGEDSGWKIFSLPAGTLPPEVEAAARLPIEAISANIHDDRIHLAIDGDAGSRWFSEFQKGSESVTIDLGADYDVDAVTTTIGGHPSDFPRQLVIESSEDKREWILRWRGSGEVPAFAALVRDPFAIPVTFPLNHIPARWLRLRQVGRDPVFYWSIVELTVYGN